MFADDLATARRDLADWSQPVIVDYLQELYARLLGPSHQSLRVLGISHGRTWRILILGDLEKLAPARREIVGISRLAGLKTQHVEQIDQAMLAELMDIIVARFHRSPAQASLYGRILLSAASRLAAAGSTVAA